MTHCAPTQDCGSRLWITFGAGQQAVAERGEGEQKRGGVQGEEQLFKTLDRRCLGGSCTQEQQQPRGYHSLLAS